MPKPAQYSQTFLALPDDSDRVTVTLAFSESLTPNTYNSRAVRAKLNKARETMLDAVQNALAEYYQSEVERA